MKTFDEAINQMVCGTLGNIDEAKLAQAKDRVEKFREITEEIKEHPLMPVYLNGMLRRVVGNIDLTTTVFDASVLVQIAMNAFVNGVSMGMEMEKE